MPHVESSMETRRRDLKIWDRIIKNRRMTATLCDWGQTGFTPEESGRDLGSLFVTFFPTADDNPFPPVFWFSLALEYTTFPYVCVGK